MSSGKESLSKPSILLPIELRTNEEETKRVLERVSGKSIERRLLALAQIGGSRIEGIPEQEERYAVNRVALTEADHQAREQLLEPWMVDSGMKVDKHPLGLIGTFFGKDPTLAPLIIISHTDSVPKAGMYDGPMGVTTGIEIVNAIHKEGIVPERSIIVVSVTGEESSGFGFALFGSRGIFHGLTDADLDQRRKGGGSIREALGPDDSQVVKTPIFGVGKAYLQPYASIEYHIEQHRRLDENGIDIGIVERIAAPIRHAIEIGDASIQPDDTVYPNARYLQLSVAGKADHSGATPMGEERADGLVATSEFLLSLLDNPVLMAEGNLAIGEVNIEAQAINKIPGPTNTILRLSSDNVQNVEKALEKINEQIQIANEKYQKTHPKFDQEPFALQEYRKPMDTVFFKRKEIITRQRAGMEMIIATNKYATAHTDKKVVGTIGTWTTTPEGKLILEIDVRGVIKEPRDETFQHISEFADALSQNGTRVDMGKPSAGSGAAPSDMNPRLMQTATAVIEKYQLGTYMIMDSPAGHDTQNVERTNTPTVVIFSQSNNGGISHHPDEYTNPDNMQKGARATAALVMELVMRKRGEEIDLAQTTAV